ncbi:MAG: hypothetical protein MUF54_18040 [Polyangiaceae bacterium]|jgi:hypothetical protein|nr:hypothetical protein [Polyangiaceae bacterium]
MRGSSKRFSLGTTIGVVFVGMSTTAFAQAPAAPLRAGTDHDNVVGRLAVGYLGASQVAVGVDGSAIAGGGSIVVSEKTVLAPVIGVRYWVSQMVGVDAGLGFWTEGGEQKATLPGVATETTDTPSYSAFIVHGGLPLSLAQGKHFSFQVVPELNLGFASGDSQVGIPMGGTVKADHSGTRFDIGARAGAELHFGFIAVPELSLQGSIGMRFAMTKTKSEVENSKWERSGSSLGTTVGDNPWNIFTTNVAALYYF